MQVHSRLTVADLLALRGVRTLSMLRTETNEEAAAAQAAGIDLISIEIEQLEHGLRAVAPTIFTFPSISYGRYQTEEQCLAAGFRALKAGGDAVYCAARTQTIRRLAEEGIPVCGHVGLIPSKATWTGGFKAVGKTADSAMLVYQQVKDLEAAGAIAAELEVVPDRVAAEISKRTKMLMLSMGAGSGGDAQYLFAEDVLGYTRGHRPRHAKTYRNFRAEYERLQAERVAAFKEFIADVDNGVYPAPEHIVQAADEEFEAFLGKLGN